MAPFATHHFDFVRILLVQDNSIGIANTLSSGLEPGDHVTFDSYELDPEYCLTHPPAYNLKDGRFVAGQYSYRCTSVDGSYAVLEHSPSIIVDVLPER